MRGSSFLNYLTTYHPLVETRRGRAAIDTFGFPPYVDDSCRREPDFESEFPSITALCRRSKFAPRLWESDYIAYMTIKGKYPDLDEPHWRLTAILRVVNRFETHREAANWYQEQGLPLPSNCIVDGNLPFELEMTGNRDSHQFVRFWDAIYRKRVRDYSMFLVTEPEFLEITYPPIVTETMLQDIFGRVPATRTPPRITDEQLMALIEAVAI